MDKEFTEHTEPPDPDAEVRATVVARLRKDCRYKDALNVLCGPTAPHLYCLPCEAAREIELLEAIEQRAKNVLSLAESAESTYISDWILNG